jgi:prevent-host-death family protein
MKEAKISEVKNQLSRYLSLVRRGEPVRILDRSTPIAMLVPLSHPIDGDSSDTALLVQMERKGLIRRGTGRVDREILDGDPPGKPAGVLKALLDERDRR